MFSQDKTRSFFLTFLLHVVLCESLNLIGYRNELPSHMWSWDTKGKALELDSGQVDAALIHHHFFRVQKHKHRLSFYLESLI